MRIGAVVGVLVANAVPVAGILAFGWSIGTVMLLICIEYLIVALLVTARMAWHARQSGDPIHQDPVLRLQALRMTYAPFEGETPERTPSAARMQGRWVFIGFVFLFFGLIIPFAFTNKWPEQAGLWLPVPGELGWGTLGLLLAWGAGFAAELPALARRSFRAMVQEADDLQARAVSIALTIIFAGVAVGHFDSPWAWLPVQVLCKFVFDMKLALAPRDERPAGALLSEQWVDAGARPRERAGPEQAGP